MMASVERTPLIMQFDAQGKRFAIELRPNQNFPKDDIIVRTFHDDEDQDQGSIVNGKIDGRAYIGERMVVIEHQALNRVLEKVPEGEIMSVTPQEGVSVVRSPSGRFYIDQSQGTAGIIGGFIYNDKFMSVQSITHPTLKLAAKHFKSMRTETSPETEAQLPDDLIISVQSLADMDREYQNYTSRCGHDHLKYNHDPKGASSFFAQKALEAAGKILGGTAKLYARTPAGCPTTEKVIYFGVVADCNYVAQFNGNLERARANIINDFNLASAIFEEAYNVGLGIIRIDIMSKCNKDLSHFNVPCSPKVSLDERLSRFSRWRGTQSAEPGLYHLVSGCSDSAIVGIAWLNQVCQVRTVVSSDGDYVSGTAVTVFLKNQFSVIAHEVSHNFGAVHDCDKTSCSQCRGGEECPCCPCSPTCDCQARYIMDPESGGRNVQKFSPCTIKDVCRKIPILAASCIKEPGSLKTITNAQCGNGIKEEGEECDCGGPEACKDNPCCTGDCKLRPGAVCSDGNDSCCHQCKIIPASAKKICTPSEGKCQVDSFCDGVKASCPVAKPLPDGTICADDGSTCASGQCTSRSAQCLAVGTRLGFKGDCPEYSESCTMTCMTARGCVALEAYFVDGTPCGHSGKCYRGQCDEAAWVTLAWKYSYLIGFIVLVLGIFLLVTLIKGLIHCCRKTE